MLCSGTGGYFLHDGDDDDDDDDDFDAHAHFERGTLHYILNLVNHDPVKIFQYFLPKMSLSFPKTTSANLF